LSVVVVVAQAHQRGVLLVVVLAVLEDWFISLSTLLRPQLYMTSRLAAAALVVTVLMVLWELIPFLM
jgi:hypothetical protein